MAQYKVKAVGKGYYKDKFRNEGDVFWLHSPEYFSSIWMKSLDSNLDKAIKDDPKLKARHGRLFEKKTKEGIKVLEPKKHTKKVEEEPPVEDEEIEVDPPLDDEPEHEGAEEHPESESDDAI